MDVETVYHISQVHILEKTKCCMQQKEQTPISGNADCFKLGHYFLFFING